VRFYHQTQPAEIENAYTANFGSLYMTRMTEDFSMTDCHNDPTKNVRALGTAPDYANSCDRVIHLKTLYNLMRRMPIVRQQDIARLTRRIHKDQDVVALVPQTSTSPDPETWKRINK
jgi:hypothetical protein